MQSVTLNKSSKIIIGSSSFDSKDGEKLIKIEVVVSVPTGNKTKNGYDEFKKEVKPYYFNRSILGADFDKKSDEEICQELLGKSLLTTVSIADK